MSEDLARRLERVHSPLDVTAFRVRQLGLERGVGFAAGALLAHRRCGRRPPSRCCSSSAAPLLAFLVVEQQLARRRTRWKRRLFLELPVVAEQLAMLLSAGYSLGAALNRLAAAGTGACARDLARVCGRIRQGLSEVDALREWATVADVDALDRLVAVLALNREAGDLGRLLSEEARAIRKDVQRGLVETVERRASRSGSPSPSPPSCPA